MGDAELLPRKLRPLSLLGRETTAEVVLQNRLRAAIEKLNPGFSPNAIEIAVQEVTKDRSTLSPARANQAVYKLLKDGVKVTYRRDDDEEEAVEIVSLIDWKNRTTTISSLPRSSGFPANMAKSVPTWSGSSTVFRWSS